MQCCPVSLCVSYEVDKIEQLSGKVIYESGVKFLLHDLRRTFATYADSLEIKHTTIKRLMNHKNKDVTYEHYINQSIETLRTPMQKITDYIMGKIK